MKRYDIKTTDTETLRKWYYLMSLGRALDEKAPSYLLQSLGWSYHAPYAGHDGIQLAIGQVFHRGEDYLFPYYRDMLTVLSAGMTAEEIILNGISKATDPSSESRELIFNFEDTDGIIQGLHNKNNSIAGFARACFNYGLDLHQDVWFATKDTISKKYDHTFKDIFQEIYDNEYKEKFEAAGIEYFYTLIDDAVARVIRSHGGYIWACKNYDGDVMSDMVSTAYGSLAMMTSVLVSPDGIYEYEAAHGTVQRHYYKYLKGEETSTNSVATIFAWSGALRKRGEMDNLPELIAFADKLEKATIQTIEDGVMTGDLYLISKLENKKKVNSKEFLEAINERLVKLMA